jgi:hypothetical protein
MKLAITGLIGFIIGLGITLCLRIPLHATSYPGGIIADQQAVNQFTTIPQSAIIAASQKRLLMRHASVGQNINDGLDALASQNSIYNRSNWHFEARGNPGWQEKVDDLVSVMGTQTGQYDIFTMKFCYIDPDAQFSYYRDHMEQLETQYPTKTVIWWTIPLTNDGDAALRDTFNQLVRSFAQTHNKALMDIAAIESHDPSGSSVVYNGHEGMYSGYTSDGGHLNAQGAERVAKAFWWLMARASGWNPSGNQTSTVTPTVTLTTTTTPIPTTTKTPTPTSTKTTTPTPTHTITQTVSPTSTLTPIASPTNTPITTGNSVSVTPIASSNHTQMQLLLQYLSKRKEAKLEPPIQENLQDHAINTLPIPIISPKPTFFQSVSSQFYNWFHKVMSLFNRR